MFNNGAIDVNCTKISSIQTSNKNTDTELFDNETTENTHFRNISPTFIDFHEGQVGTLYKLDYLQVQRSKKS